jgi:hypothetical protein
MDFAYDLLDKMQEEDTDYLLVTLGRGEDQFKVDVFYQLTDEDSALAMLAVIENIEHAIKDGDHKKHPPEGEEDAEE